MKIKDVALFLLASSIFMAVLSQYDRNIITKVIFVGAMGIIGYGMSKVAFPEKKNKKETIP